MAFDDSYGQSSSFDAMNDALGLLREHARWLREGEDITDLLNEELLLREADFEIVKGFVAAAKLEGTFEVHFGGARIPAFEFVKEEETTLGDLVDEVSSFLASSQRTTPMRAVLTAIARMPEAAYEKWKTSKIRRMTARRPAKVATSLSFEFDAAPFEETITYFESLVAKCFKNDRLWKRVTEAVFSKEIIETHMQDLLVYLAGYTESKAKKAPVVGITMFKSTATNISTMLANIRDTVMYLLKRMEYLASADALAAMGDFLGDIDTLQLKTSGDLDEAENATTGNEYIDKLESYYGTLNSIYHKLDAMHKVYENRSSPIDLLLTEQIAGFKYTVGSLAKAADVSSMTIKASIMRFAKRYPRSAVRNETADLTRRNFEVIKNNFWDIQVNPIGSEAGIPMLEYKTSGFSSILIEKLKELGLVDADAIKAFDKVENDIFSEAPARAAEAFEKFAGEHFANWK